MALLFADSFDHYDATYGAYKYDSGTPPVASGGRRGTNCASFGTSSGGLVRNIGTHTAVVAGGAFFVTYSAYYPLGNKWGAGAIFANSATSNNMLMALGYQGVMQMGIAVAPDGSLHVIRGSAFDLGASSLASALVASSAPAVFRFNQWQYLEMKVTPTACTVRVNGVAVITYTSGDLTQDGLPGTFTQFYIHGGSATLAGNGWAGKLDDLYVFDTSGATNNDFVGDVSVDYLRPNGAGVASDSVIGGTSPAATRWQSVDDTVPDGDVTYVTLEADTDADSYAHEDLPYDEADVFAVQHVLSVRKSATGLAGVIATQRVNSTDDAGPTISPAGGEYATILTPFDTSADGAWTLEKFNDSEFGVQRVAV